MLPTEFLPNRFMEGMEASDIETVLRVDRENALYSFLLYLIPFLSDRGYNFANFLQATAQFAYEDVKSSPVAHLIWDALNVL